MTKKRTKYIAYYRVSTTKQGVSGLGLEAQKASVQEFIRANGGMLVEEFQEVESGKHQTNRPQLIAALKRCKLTNSVLLVAKLDRLSRNATFLLTLRDSQTKFVCADMPDANNLTIGILALVAEYEREAISQRTKDALAAAKARGVKLGNPNGNPKGNRKTALNARKAHITMAKSRAADLAEVITDARQSGCKSLQSIADHLNDLGITSPRGGVWYAAGIQRVLNYNGGG